MSRPDDVYRLRHMFDHAREAMDLVAAKQRRHLDTDRVLCLALARLMEIVGEAAARVTPETRNQIPLVPWSGIVGLRNRLIHGYDSMDLDILWTILSRELPELVEELGKHIDREERR